jgi:hypothetical protein
MKTNTESTPTNAGSSPNAHLTGGPHKADNLTAPALSAFGQERTSVDFGPGPFVR